MGLGIFKSWGRGAEPGPYDNVYGLFDSAHLRDSAIREEDQVMHWDGPDR